mmetsp:Transcript_28013/g.5116  ORF Transcript_28013/g.5116 Transcript_28013/m.5116 type:complete len:97 (+) Transcript_28013:333-623(+)
MGELLSIMFANDNIRVYSVIGAASLTSSVTHSLSVAVIVFELTGQINHLIPMLVTIMFSYTIGSFLSPSIYDVIFEAKQLNFLPSVKKKEFYDLTA